MDNEILQNICTIYNKQKERKRLNKKAYDRELVIHNSILIYNEILQNIYTIHDKQKKRKRCL